MPEEKTDYGPDWWYSHDLIFCGQYNRLEMTIVGFHDAGTITNSMDEVINAPVLDLKLKSTTKRLKLNKSNTILGIMAIGEQPGEKWVGHEILIEPRMVMSFGEVEPALRIVPKGEAISKSKRMRLMGAKAIRGAKYTIGKHQGKKWIFTNGEP